MNIVVVGRGSLGTVLTRVLRARTDDATSVGNIRGRAQSAAEIRRLVRADVIVFAVADGAIRVLAATLAPHLRRTSVALHMAGARTATELEPLRTSGLQVGVVHPMVSFAAGSRPTGFEGATFVGAGDRRAMLAAKRLARLVGARFVEADVHGPAYHAAAALVANGAVALAWAGAELLVSRGVARRDAERALAGLLGTVARNVGEVGVPAALTGPIARGDAATVRQHRAVLASDSAASSAQSAYDGVAPSVLACAVARGLDPDAASAVAEALGAPIAARPRGGRPGAQADARSREASAQRPPRAPSRRSRR